MWVIKIGGSLQDSSYLSEWLDIVLQCGGGKVVIVPGGGKFADAIRQCQIRNGFDDISAHKMALLAMEQYARLFKERVPELQLVDDISAIHACEVNKRIAVWLPYKMVVGASDIPASWEVTSDGLAAWLAIKLQYSSLILVKSVSMPTNYSTYEELAARGLIDTFLVQLQADSSLDINWMEKNEAELLPAVLKNESSIQEFKLLNSYKASSSRDIDTEIMNLCP